MHNPFAPVDDEGGLALPSNLLSNSVSPAPVIRNLFLVSRSNAEAASLRASSISELVELLAFPTTPFSCFNILDIAHPDVRKLLQVVLDVAKLSKACFLEFWAEKLP